MTGTRIGEVVGREGGRREAGVFGPCRRKDKNGPKNVTAVFPANYLPWLQQPVNATAARHFPG